MKQIKVSEKCNGCGVCTVSCKYLIEDANGNAISVIGKAISEEDMKNVQRLYLNAQCKR